MGFDGILIALHFGSNIGYAIAPLERTFYEMAMVLVDNDESRVHFSYQNLEKGRPASLPYDFNNIITLSFNSANTEALVSAGQYIRQKNIKVAFGFDMSISLPIFQVMRKAGVNKIISYYGTPLSSINSGIKLLIKRLEVKLRSNKPDHYIFESKAMQQAAIYGRGINEQDTSVVNLGVDIKKFTLNSSWQEYAYKAFGIPMDRKILFYSGHMETRKGVDTIIEAVTYLTNELGRNDFHMLLLGNKNGDEKRFQPVYEGTVAQNHITFGGYRNDLNKLMASCYLGIIASNGWDSFPRSAIEMGASGLPLIVSNFQGLIETISDGETGKSFAVNDHVDLANKIVEFLDNEELRDRFSVLARNRALKEFTLETQLNNLVNVVQLVIGKEKL